MKINCLNHWKGNEKWGRKYVWQQGNFSIQTSSEPDNDKNEEIKNPFPGRSEIEKSSEFREIYIERLREEVDSLLSDPIDDDRRRKYIETYSSNGETNDEERISSLEMWIRDTSPRAQKILEKVKLDAYTEMMLAHNSYGESREGIAKEAAEAKAKKLTRESRTDELTQIGNRRQFDESLDSIAARIERNGFEAAILMFDIDNFKSANDTYGHDVGDELLQAFARVIQKHSRAGEELMRFGGEEFVILLENVGLKEAEEAANRLRKEIEKDFLMEAAKIIKITPEELKKKDFKATASIGVTILQSKEATKDENKKAFLSRASEALHKAKNAGRNRVIALDANAQVTDRKNDFDVGRRVSQLRDMLPQDPDARKAVLAALVASEGEEPLKALLAEIRKLEPNARGGNLDLTA